jgi:hypothetical protein
MEAKTDFFNYCLSGNDLGRKTGAELAAAFAGIPAGVTSFDFSNNRLGKMTTDELAKFFKAISTVSFIDPIDNDTSEIKSAELTQKPSAIGIFSSNTAATVNNGVNNDLPNAMEPK